MLELYRKNMRFFLKYHPLHQVNVLVHLCHITYVTTVNKCSDLVVTPAKYMILNYMNEHDIYATKT